MKGKLSEGSGSVSWEGVDFREIKRWNGHLPDGAGLLMNLHYQLISTIQTGLQQLYKTILFRKLRQHSPGVKSMSSGANYLGSHQVPALS